MGYLLHIYHYKTYVLLQTNIRIFVTKQANIRIPKTTIRLSNPHQQV